MWQRVELKKAAKKIVKKRKWTASLSAVHNYYLALIVVPGTIINFRRYGLRFVIISSVMLVGYLIFLRSAFIVSSRLCQIENRIKEPPEGKLGYFLHNHYRNVTKVMFIRSLSVLMWSFVFIVPGLIKSYEYRMVPYLLAENPTMEWRKVLSVSKELTIGQKWEIFKLDWSFLALIILGFATGGLGFFFTQPYIDATNAELYSILRQKSLNEDLTTFDELKRFVPSTSDTTATGL